MANCIRNNDNIHGIMIGSTEIKLSQLADDTSIFLADFESIDVVLDVLKLFHRLSGLKMNIDKTVAKCIGSLEGCKIIKTYGLSWTISPIRTLGITVTNDVDELIKENFIPKLKSFETILNLWLARGLSLKGKVTILKSLGLPKLLYPMSVLPIPSHVVENVDSMIIDFIWSKGKDKMKKNKIKKNVIIQNIEHGGIKVPSFAGMVEANRIMWIKRLLNNADGKWKSILSELVKPYSLFHIVENNLCDVYISSIAISFYKQILELWNAHKLEPQSASDFKNQILWNNKYITIAKNPKKLQDRKSISWPNFYKAGIIRLGDLFHPDGNLMNFSQIKIKYDINVNFLQIITLQKAIPSKWKLEIEHTSMIADIPQTLVNRNLFLKSKENDLCISNTSTKKVYQQIVLQHYVRPTALDRWIEIFNIEEDDWRHIFNLPYICARETMIQSMQYKIIHRIFPCNKWLHNLTILSSSKCDKCDEIDHLLHYFVECSEVMRFWKRLENWWNSTTGINIICTQKHIIFGIFYDNIYYSHINYVLLIGKWYIYRQNLNKRPICFYNFLKHLKRRLEIEECICRKNNSSHTYHTRWDILLDNW